MEYAEFYHEAMRLQAKLSSEQFQKNHPEHYRAWQQVTAHRLQTGGA